MWAASQHGVPGQDEVGGGCRGAAVLPASALSGDDRQLGSGVWPGLVTVDDLRGTGSHLVPLALVRNILFAHSK